MPVSHAATPWGRRCICLVSCVAVCFDVAFAILSISPSEERAGSQMGVCDARYTFFQQPPGGKSAREPSKGPGHVMLPTLSPYRTHILDKCVNPGATPWPRAGERNATSRAPTDATTSEGRVADAAVADGDAGAPCRKRRTNLMHASFLSSSLAGRSAAGGRPY